MERRELLKMIALATGVSLVGSKAIAYKQVSGVTLSETGFTEQDVSFLNQVGEVIIPTTKTPGAKQANVGLTMAVIVNGCFTANQKAQFVKGMEELKKESIRKYKQAFLDLSFANQTELLQSFDQQAKKANQNLQDDELPHPFTLIKQQVIFCFFTSKTGATEVLRHIAIPGSYNGELPYKKGDRAWFR